MGRTVIADDRIQTYVDGLYTRGPWFIGLIVGQLTAQKDYAVHIVRTPEPVEDQVSDEDSEEQDEIKQKKKRRKSQCKPESLDLINEQWVTTHCKQVTTMLPGGLDVIGIFAMAPPTMMQNAQTKLRQVLFAIEKTMKKMSVSSFSETITERFLLQICATTRKLTCRTIDVSDPKSTFRPAEWKQQSSSVPWHKLQTSVTLDLSNDFPMSSRNAGTLKQIQTCIQPFCENVQTGLLTFDDQIRHGLETLDQSGDGKKNKGKGKSQAPQQIFNVHLIVNKSDTCSMKDAVVHDTAGLVLVRGKVFSTAYVYTKATVKEAEQALKSDLIRSVTCRCELLCDDIDLLEEDGVTRELYNMPVRVFYPLPGTSLTLCDYIFQDEKQQEVLSRIQELLDVEVAEEDLDFSCERVATEEDCGTTLLEEISTDSNVHTKNSNNGTGLTKYIVAGLGGAVAFFAAGLSYLLTQES